MIFNYQTETRKSELETNLTTNLKRRKQELEAIILSAETETLPGEAELKRQELSDAKLSVVDVTEQLKSEGFEFHSTHLYFAV